MSSSNKLNATANLDDEVHQAVFRYLRRCGGLSEEFADELQRFQPNAVAVQRFENKMTFIIEERKRRLSKNEKDSKQGDDEAQLSDLSTSEADNASQAPTSFGEAMKYCATTTHTLKQAHQHNIDAAQLRNAENNSELAEVAKRNAQALSRIKATTATPRVVRSPSIQYTPIQQTRHLNDKDLVDQPSTLLLPTPHSTPLAHPDLPSYTTPTQQKSLSHNTNSGNGHNIKTPMLIPMALPGINTPLHTSNNTTPVNPEEHHSSTSNEVATARHGVTPKDDGNDSDVSSIAPVPKPKATAKRASVKRGKSQATSSDDDDDVVK
eukprot:PhM_4_TR4621/c1_g2_i1/m.43128